MEAVTTLVGQVLDLGGSTLDFLLKNPVLSIPLGISIAGALFGLIRRARHV